MPRKGSKWTDALFRVIVSIRFGIKNRHPLKTPVDASRIENERHPNDCFILGSGRSLLDLTSDEVAYINRCPFVLGFNKYLIFYKKVGVIPTHYYIGDLSVRAKRSIREVMEVCVSDNLDVNFILSYKSLRPLLRDTRFIRFFKSHNFNQKTFLVTRTDWLEGGRWANSLNQQIYHYRGSLSSAINITTILNPGRKIKLIGVDLNDHRYFFQEEIEADKERWNVFIVPQEKQTQQHGTTKNFRKTQGIQSVIPFIKEQVEKNGGSLCCGFKSSFIVQEGLVVYESIIE